MNSSETDRHRVSFEVETLPVTDLAALHDEVCATDPAYHWDALTPMERRAMVALVGAALDRMRSDIEAWLPEAIVARPHSRFGIFVLWENATLHEEVLRQVVAADEERRERLADLLRLAGSATSD